ncbi:phospholipase D-like domain-containing protein [[Phormidium] sp. ETS-05]|uniref:phospholipase D-like domain-containing protein n=1 Tax=[Phormidium] sp. ETS-05 TaxID=222819 RepID=UPI0031FE7B7B
MEQIIADSIAAATTRIDVAVQEFRLPKIAAALTERHQAGVQVRVIVENTYSRPWSELTAAEVGEMDARMRSSYDEFILLADINGDGTLSPEEINARDALVMLRNAGVPVIDDTADGSKGSGLMHHKFVIIDGTTTIVTSANFTKSDIHGDFGNPDSLGNANNLLKIESPELAALFVQEFDLMWGSGRRKLDSKFGVKKPPRGPVQLTVGGGTIAVQFSPTGRKVPWQNTTNGLIEQTLAGAVSGVDLALFVFSEQRLADVLLQKHQQGVEVRALIDPGFAYRSYSEGLDMLGVALADKNCRYEEGNLPWPNPIASVGVPQLPRGDKLHHKFAVIDGTKTIAGSQNWTPAANQQNDETLLVIDNPTVAAHYVREFDRLYTNAQLGIPSKIQDKIKQQQCSPS